MFLFDLMILYKNMVGLMHAVNLALILQVERVSHRDNLQSFVQKSENLEKQCLAKAIKSYCQLQVLPYEQNRTVVF